MFKLKMSLLLHAPFWYLSLRWPPAPWPGGVGPPRTAGGTGPGSRPGGSSTSWGGGDLLGPGQLLPDPWQGQLQVGDGLAPQPLVAVAVGSSLGSLGEQEHTQC